MDLAERLQELRKTAGYSQEQVAELLGLSSTDYILLGVENKLTVPERKKMEKEYREAIKAISIIAATAIITVLFITSLSLLQKFGL